jgi:tripartite-type tricarboxylate transporter receptor subunit TctC
LEMKKKTLGGLLAVALLGVSVLAGCGTSATTANSNSSSAKKEEPKYPTKAIDYVVPFGAGGSNDLTARATSEYLSKEWGHPINVVNKPGGGGAVGTQEVLKSSKPDGYTVVAASTSSTSTLIAGNANLPFKLTDFKFISKVIEDPLSFVVKADAPWNTLKEFSDWAKNNPDQLSYATPGPSGTATFATAEWLEVIGGDFSKAKMITTVGASESLPKVAGGHITLAILNVSEVSTMVKAGKLKMLAVSANERSPFFPDVPTADQAGIKNLTVKFFNGVAAPANTPDYIVKQWDEAIAKMTKDPVFIEKLKAINAQPTYMSSADLTKSVTEETEKFTDVATKKGLRK